MTDRDSPPTPAAPTARPGRHTAVRRTAVTLAVLGAVAATLVLLRPRTTETATDNAATDQPEACLAALLQAERAGNVPAWRACLADPLRDEADARLAATSEREFALALRGTVADLKGHATTDVQLVGPDAARATVELIFADHNEREAFDLRRTPDGWRITGRSGRTLATPPVRYGTPVTPMAE